MEDLNPYKSDTRMEQTIGAVVCDAHIVFNQGIKAFIEWGSELCQDDKHSSGYWEGDGFDDKGKLRKGKFHYDNRFNCSECMQEAREMVK
jgi:hypothetical protein